MALFKVGTGLREREVVNLRWSWEVAVPELNTSVFVVPWEFVKNGLDRFVCEQAPTFDQERRNDIRRALCRRICKRFDVTEPDRTRVDATFAAAREWTMSRERPTATKV